jgi:hypothetical protein
MPETQFWDSDEQFTNAGLPLLLCEAKQSRATLPNAAGDCQSGQGRLAMTAGRDSIE